MPSDEEMGLLEMAIFVEVDWGADLIRLMLDLEDRELTDSIRRSQRMFDILSLGQRKVGLSFGSRLTFCRKEPVKDVVGRTFGPNHRVSHIDVEALFRTLDSR